MPAEIFRELQTARPQGWASASIYQIYYQWQLENSRIWRRDPDPLCSAQNLLSENTDITSCLYRVDNIRGLHIVRARGCPANSINRPTQAETRNPDTSTRRDLSAFEVVLAQETQRRRGRGHGRSRGAEHEANQGQGNSQGPSQRGGARGRRWNHPKYPKLCSRFIAVHPMQYPYNTHHLT